MSEFENSLVPRSTLIGDVIPLTVDSPPFVVLVGEIEGITFLQEQINHIFGRRVILLEGTFSLLKIINAFALFGLVEITPSVLNHFGSDSIDYKLGFVHMIDVIKTDIIIVVIVAEDDGTRSCEIAGIPVALYGLWFNHHW